MKVLKLLLAVELCCRFTWVQILTPGPPWLRGLRTSGQAPQSLGFLVYHLQMGAAPRDTRTRCIRCEAHSGLQFFSPGLPRGLTLPYFLPGQVHL